MSLIDRSFTLGGMSGIGERLQQALDEIGLSQNELARRIQIRQSSISALINGKARGTKYLLAIAREVQQDPEWLESAKGQFRRHRSQGSAATETKRGRAASRFALAPDVLVAMRQVPVVGAVQAGVWLATVELPLADRFDIPLPIQAGFDNFDVFGLIVRGASMDELYPHGSILAVVKFLDLGREPRQNERVVALRYRHGETEATVKEFRVGRDGRARLWPRSTHPDFQQPVLVQSAAGDDEEVQIAYLVIGSYRPEV